MSILLPRYSGFPPEIFERGLVPQMSGSALRLYLFLCRTSDRKSRLSFAATDQEITEQSGASTGALRKARIDLKALGLISYAKAPGGSYTYALCDPTTRQPFPGDQKMKQRYVKRGARIAKQETKDGNPSDVSALPAQSLVKESNSSGDTSFDFGYNEKPKKSSISAGDINPFEPSRSRK